jgi:ubiquinone/menaquinone biosynthesis C-methylase UbiE
MAENPKQQVREFYDQIGWSQDGEGFYQNARYEDLRLVSHDYIHNCHMRVKQHLASSGDFLLDAGSGPVQYSEYLTYSEGYHRRLCLDLSIIALREARQKLGELGLYVVADVADLPFKTESFDGIVSLHTFHHLPLSEHRRAYLELYRTLKPGRTAAVVNGWYAPPLMRMARPLVRWLRWLRRGNADKHKKDWLNEDDPEGTFVKKLTPDWLKNELKDSVPFEIYPWRSLSTVFIRWFIHPKLGGKLLLRLVFWLEDRFPRFFGENGQYPLIVIHKPEMS